MAGDDPEVPRTGARSLSTRLMRWGSPGLRGQIVGAVLITTVVTLGVAALVLLPQLERSLRTASQNTLSSDIRAARPEIRALGRIDYRTDLALVDLPQFRGTAAAERARAQFATFQSDLTSLRERLGTEDVFVIGDIDASGHGRPVGLPGGGADGVAGISQSSLSDVEPAFFQAKVTYAPYTSFDQIDGSPNIRAAIKLPNDAVLAIRKDIDEIPAAARAVARAFELAALAGLVLTALLAIPLAATLVRRLQRLREAAQRVAVEGAGAVVPTDRARDEVGDLARSFAIMQRRLMHQEEARRAFVATASHELRTPLASLEGMLELLADDLETAEPDLAEATTLLERARAQSRRLARLAADLLDLSRIDAEVPLRSESVELGELARAVVAEFELTSDDRGVSVRVLPGQQPIWVLGDPGKIAQVLRILLDNALRVAPAGSDVVVSLRDGALMVSDAGPGVAPEERELIFERFKRGTETGGEAGFGLGLAIGRELARRMGGELALAPGGPGASLELSLPATDAPEGETPPLGAAPGAGARP